MVAGSLAGSSAVVQEAEDVGDGSGHVAEETCGLSAGERKVRAEGKIEAQKQDFVVSETPIPPR